MNKAKKIKEDLVCEIYQKYETQKKLLFTILCSKRLLSEHLENLEEIVNILQNNNTEKTSNYLTLLSTTSILVSSFGFFHCISNNFRYIMPSVAGVVSILYLRKTHNLNQGHACEAQLKKLIKSLDDFEFSIKKTSNFLNDAQYIKTQANYLNRCNQGKRISTDLLLIINRVIRAMYCFVKYLEYCFKIDEKFQYFYQEIDDVDNCCTMMDLNEENTNPNIFKEMFALFAYVQSYLLLRLGFIFATNLDESKFILSKRICDMTDKINNQIALLPNFLLLQKEEIELQNNVQKLVYADANKIGPNDLIQIRSSTIDLTLKTLSLIFQLKDYQNDIVALTNNYNNANKIEMEQILSCLESIGLKISLCSDEQSRLMILWKKYLNKDTTEIEINNVDENIVKSDHTQLKIIKYDDVQQQSDDFFYVGPQHNVQDAKDFNEKDSKTIQDLNEEDVHIEITKKCFKPVLAQLKKRIVTIDANMKEREMKVLKEKGIEITKEPEIEIETGENSNDDSDSEIDLKRGQRCDQNRKKFDESREFLQSKIQNGLFGLSGILPVNQNFIALSEDVLE